MSNMLRPVLGFNPLKHPLLLQPSLKNVVFESHGSDGNYKLVRRDFRLMSSGPKHSLIDKGLDIAKIQEEKNDSMDIQSSPGENLDSNNNNNNLAGASLEPNPTGEKKNDSLDNLSPSNENFISDNNNNNNNNNSFSFRKKIRKFCSKFHLRRASLEPYPTDEKKNDK